MSTNGHNETRTINKWKEELKINNPQNNKLTFLVGIFLEDKLFYII